jgi:triacylglycerol lipase
MLVGKEFRVPVLLHPWMLVDARSLKVVAEELSAPVNLKPSYG